MPTARDILNAMRFEPIAGRDEGSCFGVTDPSRLRAISNPEPMPQEHLCHSCHQGRHECEGKVNVFTFSCKDDVLTGEPLFTPTRREVPCECKKCHP